MSSAINLKLNKQINKHGKGRCLAGLPVFVVLPEKRTMEKDLRQE
jgi:hypothetical protein